MNAIIEPFFICLIASMIWAPVVFLIAARLSEKEASLFADKLWPTALLIAAAPALFAPVAAAFGLSLRTPAPLPPMAEPVSAVRYMPVAETVAEPAVATTVNLAEILAAMAGLYFYGFLLFFALGAVRMVWFSYRVGYALELDEPKLEASLEDWRRRMNIKRKVRYAFTDAVSSVCVHGFFRPVVLMPMHLLDRVSMNDAILMGAHEMAHIKRGDTWLFAFASAMKAVFWFNPFILRIAARANLAAEQAADALVIASGANRRAYARCFVEGLRFAAGAARPEYALVPSFTPFDKRSRRERLDAILSGAAAAPLLNLSSKVGLGLSILFASAVALAQAALAVSPPPAKDALPKAPIEGKVEIGFGFGEKSKLLGKDRPSHEGVDIRAARGTPVHAAGGGKVIDATSRYKGSDAWGNVVVIDHGHGLVTRYAHLDSFSVRKGERVGAGAVIGAVGSTGKATGPHLHFEVIKDGEPIDPAPVIGVKSAARGAPTMKTARKVTHTPAPMIAPAPLATPATVAEPALPDAPDTPEIAPAPAVIASIAAAPEVAEPETVEEKIERKLAGKRVKWNDRFRENMKDFQKQMEAANLAVEFSELEFDNFEEFVGDMGEFEFNFDGLDDIGVDLSGISFMVENGKLTKEQRDEIRKAHEKAMRDAEKAVAEAERSMERAMRDREAQHREMQHNLERAQRESEQMAEREERKHELMAEQKERQRELIDELKERQRERMDEQKERQRERMAEQKERQRERLEEQKARLRDESARRLSERERAALDEASALENKSAARKAWELGRAEAEREWVKETQPASREQLIELRENALDEAQQRLDEEREEIERIREELEEELARVEEDAWEE